MKSKFIVFVMLMMIIQKTKSCPVCERNQPKLLRGVVHGIGPQSNWDYIIVWFAIIITLITLFYTIKWLIKPDEMSQSHIKYSILK